MSEVVNRDDVIVNGRVVWRAGVADQSSVMSVVTITSTTLVVPRAGKTSCCWTGTCQLHCSECGSRTTLIVLGLLALGVLITVAVIGLTWTAMPLTVDFIDFNGTLTHRTFSRLFLPT